MQEATKNAMNDPLTFATGMLNVMKNHMEHKPEEVEELKNLYVCGVASGASWAITTVKHIISNNGNLKSELALGGKIHRDIWMPYVKKWGIPFDEKIVDDVPIDKYDSKDTTSSVEDLKRWLSIMDDYIGRCRTPEMIKEFYRVHNQGCFVLQWKNDYYRLACVYAEKKGFLPSSNIPYSL